MLAESEEVHDSLVAEQEERRKSREVKRARQTFETNALVVPDAATAAALEKELLVTATKGAVALFNAVAKAQRGRGGRAREGAKGEVVSKESFMSMMRAGVGKKVEVGEKKVGDEVSEDEGERGGGAEWLRTDYLTTKSKTLRDWDKEAAPEVSSSGEENEQVGSVETADGSEGEGGSGSDESDSDKSDLNN